METINDQAIIPVTPEWGKFETLTTVAELASCLLREWPDGTQTETYITALMVCDAVLAGSEEDAPEHARAAFIDAAHESGFSVSPDDDDADLF